MNYKNYYYKDYTFQCHVWPQVVCGPCNIAHILGLLLSRTICKLKHNNNIQQH